jgi:hypothetical protein
MDRPAFLTEIEITPEMVEAGASVLWKELSTIEICHGLAKELAERILRRALSVSDGRTHEDVS